MIEIEDIHQFSAWASSEAPAIAAVQGLDLREEAAVLLRLDLEGSLFIGCDLAPEAAGHVVSTGGLMVSALDGFEFRTHRPGMYTPEELYDGFDPEDREGFFKTLDHRVYEEYCHQGRAFPASIKVSLARRLHDHGITDALMDFIDGRRVVAVMGGHGLERADGDFARVARISRELTRRGFLMVSGGGPGAMEATHLGAYLAAQDDGALDEALAVLAPRSAGAVAGKEYADADWLHRAWRVRRLFPLEGEAIDRSASVGIPTWLYGHEPPTPFATHIAKYFANSVREDGLLMIARYGVIFAKGSSGTTQEIFQDAAQNHYKTADWSSPMVLLGREFWTHERPVWPLLEKVSRDEDYGRLVWLTDSEEEAVRRIVEFEPEGLE